MPDTLRRKMGKELEGKNLAAEGETIIQKMDPDRRAQSMKIAHIAKAQTKEQMLKHQDLTSST